MSILVEIAEKADVSVEGVVRVLTREPVSDAIKERVLDVLDDLTPEQTRAVQRFALAALHDVLPRPGDSDPDEGPVAPDASQLTLPVAAAEPLLPGSGPGPGSEAALVQLGSVLGELAEAVRDLRRETDAERRERVDDLAVLIDLITTGWQGLDARLGRIERQVSRLESARREPFAPVPMLIAPAAIEAPPAAAAPIEHDPEPEPDPELEPSPPVEPSLRDRLPFVAALALVGAGVVTLAVLQLASGGPDLSGLVSARESSSTTGEIPASTASPTTGAETRPATTTGAETRPATTTARPPALRPTAPATTSNVLGTTAAGTTTAATTRPAPPAATTAAPRTTSAPPAATTRPAPTPPASPAGFRPTRDWAWAPAQGADYYVVEFSRAGTVIYRATPTEPRLTLPDSVVFRPGPYRWVVRAGFGEPAERGIGATVVDSSFTVS